MNSPGQLSALTAGIDSGDQVNFANVSGALTRWPLLVRYILLRWGTLNLSVPPGILASPRYRKPCPTNIGGSTKFYTQSHAWPLDI